MNNSLALIPSQNEFAAMVQQADVLYKSGLLPQTIRSAQAVVAIMMLGRELNIPPWQALMGINVISGKPTISPQLMLALIERSGLQEDIAIDSQPTYCTVTMKRKGRTAHIETFTLEHAKAMNLLGKDNYNKQPATMLKWRAVSACARVVYPDVLMGVYTTEEIAPDNVRVDADGEMEYTPMVVTTTPQLTIVAPTPPPAIDGEIIEDQAAGQTVEQPVKPKNPRRMETKEQAAPKVESDTEALMSWDYGEWPKTFIGACRLETKVDDLQLTQIGAMVGIEKAGVKQIWVDAFPDGQYAGVQAVKAAFDKQMQEITS